VSDVANDTRTRRQRRFVRAPCGEAVAAVDALRREISIDAFEDIDVLLVGAHCGLYPRLADLEGEEAHVLRSAGTGVICVARRVWEAGTWRFPYAHEIGHHRLDGGRHDDLARCTSSAPRGARRSVESAASDFAGLLLVPEDLVRARWDLRAPSFDAVVAIAGAAGVSLETAALRVLQMTRAPRAVAFSRAGVVEWWAETPAFGARVRAWRAVPEGSAAARAHDARPSDLAPAWDPRAVGEAAARVSGDDLVVTWLATG
jgi:hypothetical protein